jgi:hypothetical protein
MSGDKACLLAARASYLRDRDLDAALSRGATVRQVTKELHRNAAPPGDASTGGQALAVSQITYLVTEYADRIDSGDLEGVADLLSDAGFGAGIGPLVRGRESILNLYRKTVRLYDDGTPRTKHLVTNLVIEVEGQPGKASARSYFTVMQAAPGMPLGPILSGRYHDQFEVQYGAWQFSERRITTDLVGDVSHHVLPEATRFVERD